MKQLRGKYIILKHMLYSKVDLTFMVPYIMIQFTKVTNKMQLCRIIYCSFIALHV